MKYIIIILLLLSCGSPVERVGSENPPTKLQPIPKVEAEVTPIIKPIDDGGENDWIFIKAVQGEWKVKKQDGSSYDDYCVYEFYYSKSRNKFDLRMEGYIPKNHSIYKDVSELFGKVNQATLLGKTIKYRIDIIKSAVIEE